MSGELLSEGQHDPDQGELPKSQLLALARIQQSLLEMIYLFKVL